MNIDLLSPANVTDAVLLLAGLALFALLMWDLARERRGAGQTE